MRGKLAETMNDEFGMQISSIKVAILRHICVHV